MLQNITYDPLSSPEITQFGDFTFCLWKVTVTELYAGHFFVFVCWAYIRASDLNSILFWISRKNSGCKDGYFFYDLFSSLSDLFCSLTLFQICNYSCCGSLNLFPLTRIFMSRLVFLLSNTKRRYKISFLEIIEIT